MKYTRFLVPLLLVCLLCFAGIPVAAATTADVTITATPTYLAMTNSLATWSIGTVAESQSDAYWWDADGSGYTGAPTDSFDDAECPATITNTGSVAEDFDVKVADFTGGVGWNIAAAVGADEVVVKAGKSGDANEAAMVTLTNNDQEFISNLAAAGTKDWILHLETGTFGDGVAKEGTLTVTCRAVS